MTDAETLQKWHRESAAKLKGLEAEIQAERAFLEGLAKSWQSWGPPQKRPTDGLIRKLPAATLREAIKQEKTLPFLIRKVFEAQGGQLTAASVAKTLEEQEWNQTAW